MSFSYLPLFYAQCSLGFTPTLWVCLSASCIVIHPFLCWYWVHSSNSSVHKQKLSSSRRLPRPFSSLFGEKLLFSGPTLKMIFECKRLVKFKFLTLARCISQRWLRFWVYINSIFHAHAHFQDCTNHDTQNIILWVEKYYAKTTLDSTMASTNAHYTQWVDRLKSC